MVTELPPPLDHPTASWHEAEGRQIETIRVHGRLADMIAVPKPDRDANLGANTLKSALFATGRPVLMCPDAPAPEGFGERIAIAWNGSTESARAVALSMDLIREAKAVHILGHRQGRRWRRRPEPRGISAVFADWKRTSYVPIRNRELASSFCRVRPS